MQTMLRLAAFAALLIAVFVASLGVGAAVGPLDAPEPSDRHSGVDGSHSGDDPAHEGVDR